MSTTDTNWARKVEIIAFSHFGFISLPPNKSPSKRWSLFSGIQHSGFGTVKLQPFYQHVSLNLWLIRALFCPSLPNSTSLNIRARLFIRGKSSPKTGERSASASSAHLCVHVCGEWYRQRDELCIDIPLALLAVMELFLLISQALSTFPQGCFLVMQSIRTLPITRVFPAGRLSSQQAYDPNGDPLPLFPHSHPFEPILMAVKSSKYIYNVATT